MAIQPKRIHTAKLSDRRLAGGNRAEKYMQSQKMAQREANSPDLDVGLVEYDPSHFRLFVGNVGQDVTEELLVATFRKYKSLSKVQLPLNTKPDDKDNHKGYAFLSFASADDYLKCFREMNNKYVGSKPITLERAKGERATPTTSKGKGRHKPKKIKSKDKKRKVLV